MQAPNPNDPVSPGTDPFSVTPPPGKVYYVQATAKSGSDGIPISDFEIQGDANLKTGINPAWNMADLFNLMCIPPPQRDLDLDRSTWAIALGYCQARLALLLVDSPSTWMQRPARREGDDEHVRHPRPELVLFFPWVRVADPLNRTRLRTVRAVRHRSPGSTRRPTATAGSGRRRPAPSATLTGVPRLTRTR